MTLYAMSQITPGSGNTYSAGGGTSYQMSVTGSGNDSGILGSVANDTFTASNLSGGLGIFSYLGTTIVTLNGTQYQAFIGSQNGNYYVFYPQSDGSFVAPTTGATLTLDPASTTNTGTQWNLANSDINCFMPGTLIATPDGARAVETLRPGNHVLTADGNAVPVRWVGRNLVSRRFADPLRLLPVRICAGALDENCPTRDLLLSPGHAVFVDGVLIHAGALVNGRTIRQELDAPEQWTYYHIELDTHSLLLAEGTPAESFLDGLEVLGFANIAERVPPAAAEQLPYPRARSARQVPRAVRERMSARTWRLPGPETVAA